MARPASNRALAALFALEADDFQSPAAITSTASQPPLNLDERVDLFLRAIYGSTRRFTASERAAARDRILDSMVDELVGGSDGGIHDSSVDVAASMIAASTARGGRRSQLLRFAGMMRDALLAPLMLPLFASPQMRLVVASVITLVVAGAAWSATWFYAARTAETTIASWIDWEAKSGRIYTCGSQTVGGFPFRVEVNCVDPKVTLASEQTTLVVYAKELRTVAGLFRPSLLTTEIAGPLSVAGGTPSTTYVGNWTLAKTILRGTPASLEQISVVFDGLQFYRVTQISMEPLLAGDRLELDARISSASTANKPVFDIAAQVVGGTIDAGGPITSQPFVAEVTATLRDVNGTAPKVLSARLRDWQAAGGRLDVTSARLQQGEAIATATGTVGLNDNGRVDGMLRVSAVGPYVQLAQTFIRNEQGAAANREKIAQSLVPPHVQLRSIDNKQRTERELQREAAEHQARLRAESEAKLRAEREKQRTTPNQQVERNINPSLPAASTAPHLRPAGALEVPIRFTNGAVYFGAAQLGEIPPLF